MATPLPRNSVSIADAATLASIVGGRVLAPGTQTMAMRAICTDSREVRAGDVFVALVGENRDAHDFIDDVITRGATLLVVGRDVSAPASVGVVRVDDTLRALGALGHWARTASTQAAHLRTVIGITGSVGKTSTKEMCAAALRARAPSGAVLATSGNLNNLIGVPRTLLCIEPQTVAAIIEMGMNVPGEIARLAEIAEPQIGIVTGVCAVHTEGVGSLAGVAKEKGALLLALPAQGTAIYNADDALLAPYVASSPAQRKLGFGRHERADVRMIARTTHATGQTVTYRVAGRAANLDVELALLGEGAAKNAAAALALALAVDGVRGVESAVPALQALVPEAGRLCPITGPGNTVIVDDSYNASPRSVINAIDTATEIARTTNGRLVAVLGDMLELGTLETEMHALVGEHVALAGVSLFVACGKRMRIAAEEAREMGADFVIEVDDPMDAVAEVERFLIEGDVVVVKGSRGMRMERVVEALTLRERAA